MQYTVLQVIKSSLVRVRNTSALLSSVIIGLFNQSVNGFCDHILDGRDKRFLYFIASLSGERNERKEKEN